MVRRGRSICSICWSTRLRASAASLSCPPARILPRPISSFMVQADPIDRGAAKRSIDRTPSSAKVELFRALFKGLPAVFPVRWENRKAGKAGYSPVCANEWARGICPTPGLHFGFCGRRTDSAPLESRSITTPATQRVRTMARRRLLTWDERRRHFDPPCGESEIILQCRQSAITRHGVIENLAIFTIDVGVRN